MKETYPEARHSNIVVRELEDELLIYDLLIHKAYCLNQTSAMVYRLCDGKSSVQKKNSPTTNRETGRTCFGRFYLAGAGAAQERQLASK